MKHFHNIMKTITLMIAILTCLSGNTVVADDPNPFNTEKFATLPFVVWRNNLLFANTVMNRMAATGSCDCECSFCSKPRVFLTGLGELGTGELKLHGQKFDYNNWGVEGAADVQMSQNLVVGGAFTGFMNNFSWHSNGGNGTLNQYEGALYFNYTNADFFVSGMATGGWNNSSCRRNTFYFGAFNKPRTHQNGWDYSFYLQEGLNMNCGCWQLIPLLRVSYTSIQEKAFREDFFVDGLDLSIHQWTTSIVRAYLEGKISRTFILNGCCLIPQVFVGYALDSVVGGKHIHASLASLNDAWDRKVWSRNQGSLVAGAEVDLICGYGLATFARYDFQTNQRYTSQSAQLGVAYSF